MSETESNPIKGNDLVIIGSSVGSVEALSTIVNSLPKEFPAPVILAQHLDLNRPANLATVLQRRSALPVITATESINLEDCKVYVVPTNRPVSFKDGRIEIEPELATGKSRPSLDVLLASAASNYGENLITVLLASTGNDGVAGAVDVKNGGGTVIVQNSQNARYPVVPQALPPNIVDFELNIEQIGPTVHQLLHGEVDKQPVDDTQKILRDILEQVGRQASIDFRPYKTSTILRRINRRMAVTHNRSMQDYALYLETHPEEIGQLVQAFLINVTQFFRDTEAFTFLRDEILPRVVAQARERDRVLRFWSAGCATGEESYSLAMMITDLLGSELPEWSVKIFATDLDESAIDFARRGFYSEAMLKGVSDEYRERFFERIDHGYRISKTLRQMVIFGQQDLSRSAPFPRIDLVMCRNVLIYFTLELQDYVLNQFAFSLSASNGYLFLGKAETVRPAQTYYELVNKQWKIYRCTTSSMPAARTPQTTGLSKSRPEVMQRSARMLGRLPASEDVVSPPVELSQLRRLNEILLRFLPIGLLVIDRNYRLMTANAAARRLLGLRELANEQDFLHSVRGIPYPQVRSAIDAAFRERNVISLPEVELDASSGGNGRFLSLSIAMMQVEPGLPDLAAVSVSDVTEQVEIRRQLETAQLEQSKLMTELSEANRRLNDMNKELTDANEELQVSNEELMLTHEELQASIEEFETTNEELQATNEELETNNEELQATNEELQTTNDELRARTNELQETANVFESERARLMDMLESAPFSILMLGGPNLVIEAHNSRFDRLIQGRQVMGLALSEVPEIFGQATEIVVNLAREVYRDDSPRLSPPVTAPSSGNRTDNASRTFIYTIVPSHNIEGQVTGVVVYGQEQSSKA